MIDIIMKRFDSPDQVREFDKGKFEIIDMEKMTIGKATYAPGWKWSIDVSPLSGTQFCEVEHLGMVLSGSATVAFENGEIYTLKKGDIFYVSPLPHDSWVVGDDEYVSCIFFSIPSKCISTFYWS